MLSECHQQRAQQVRLEAAHAPGCSAVSALCKLRCIPSFRTPRSISHRPISDLRRGPGIELSYAREKKRPMERGLHP